MLGRSRGQGGAVQMAISNRMFRLGLLGEGVSHLNIWRKNIPGKEKKQIA